ncbi:integrase family protein [Pectobacterium odoriferum]|uniref:Integrase family protein n=1 Tax=Pectobacterium odoriferum TaxID=78398 RepID=A0ABR4VIC7_9GAMM|nr:tyrosine-type recombinase/integrase [Pectobacterium odoriferum]KGA39068.1 integrase family protein [Pectobacterium odoriferum]
MNITNYIAPALIGWANHSFKRVSTWLTVYESIIKAKPFDEKTLSNKLTMLRTVNSLLGNIPMRNVQPQHIVTVLNFYIEQNKNRSAQICHFLLTDLFREAEYNGWVYKNPVTSVLKPDAIVRREKLTLSEWRKIYNAALFVCPAYFHHAMRLTLVTAQRRRDISDMTRAQVFDEHLHIEQQKTGAKIAIPIALTLEAADISLRDVLSDCTGNNYMLHSRRVSPHSLTTWFQTARDTAFEIEHWTGTPPTFHEQRSLAERLYRDQGVDTRRLLGHKYQRTTDKYNNDYGKEWRRLII